MFFAGDAHINLTKLLVSLCSRTQFLYTWWFILSFSLLAERPNVSFVAADDLRTDLNCYSQTHVITPNLDRLAGEGILFDRAYCQQAVCHPSRASLMTGKLPDTVGVTSLYTDLHVAAPDVMTISQPFRQHGYVAESFGKIFHNGHGHHGDPRSLTVPPHHFGDGQRYMLEESRKARRVNRERLATAESAGGSPSQMQRTLSPSPSRPSNRNCR